MSRKERERLVVLSRVKGKELSRAEGAEVLGLSHRQMRRIYVRWRKEGDCGLLHRSRGKASVRRIEVRARERAMALYRSTLVDFGPTLFAEKLGLMAGIWVSHDTTRRWLKAEGLVQWSRRSRRSRRRRQRKERFGELVQMDGSPHAWFEARGPQSVLMTAIDDATGRRRGLFCAAETTESAMACLGNWCGEFGVPQALYVDQHSIYRSDREPTADELRERKRPRTQFGRAMAELGVELILARSPQAKGRVERSNGVLQDRLLKELRLAGISDIASANRWLKESRYFEGLDERFAVEAVNGVDLHRPVVCDLQDVLCLKEQRMISQDGCVQWHGRVLQLADPGRLRQVELWERFDGRVTVVSGGRRPSWQELDELAVEAMKEAKRRAKKKRPIVNNKPYKPGPHQQIRLRGSWPRREAPKQELVGCV